MPAENAEKDCDCTETHNCRKCSERAQLRTNPGFDRNAPARCECTETYNCSFCSNRRLQHAIEMGWV